VGGCRCPIRPKLPKVGGIANKNSFSFVDLQNALKRQHRVQVQCTTQTRPEIPDFPGDPTKPDFQIHFLALLSFNQV
jgi:hypothetical protein